jgi:hypothetical protein
MSRQFSEKATACQAVALLGCLRCCSYLSAHSSPPFRLTRCSASSHRQHGRAENVVTEGFPVDVDGNSFIRAVVELPNPCVAPIVMVLAGSEGKWFAMAGFEEEED